MSVVAEMAPVGAEHVKEKTIGPEAITRDALIDFARKGGMELEEETLKRNTAGQTEHAKKVMADMRLAGRNIRFVSDHATMTVNYRNYDKESGKLGGVTVMLSETEEAVRARTNGNGSQPQREIHFFDNPTFTIGGGGRAVQIMTPGEYLPPKVEQPTGQFGSSRIIDTEPRKAPDRIATIQNGKFTAKKAIASVKA